jgi:hypothetical protein
MLASITVRQQAGIDLQRPLCIFDLCDALGVTVRFNDIGSLEGMYESGPHPRIHLSALRPLSRRRYNCAHELGHHFFRHGTTIHELRAQQRSRNINTREELLANAFAGFLLMPTLGIWEAFATRGRSFHEASPPEVYAVACEFGVGYATLVNHLMYGLRELSERRGRELLRHTPKSLRAELLKVASPGPLIVLDNFCRSTIADAEVGSYILLPENTVALGDILEVSSLGRFSTFQAVRPGITRVIRPEPLSPMFIRVSHRNFVGLARYRHLETIN